MHYQELAEQIAANLGYDTDDVVDDVFAVVARRRWDPASLTDDQVDVVRFEAIARAETVNSVIGPAGGI